MARKAAFLDRDGVLNRSVLMDGVPMPPSVTEEVEILEGVSEAIEILIKADYLPVVVTNQPDVARGTTSRESVEQINHYIGEQIGVEHFFICFHDNSDNCECRKPKPGLLQIAATELGLDISRSFLVGDRWRDIEAGQAAGCPTFFIDYSYPERSPEKPFTPVSSLLEAVKIMTGDAHGTK